MVTKLIVGLIIVILIYVIMSMTIFFFLSDRRAKVDAIFEGIVPSERDIAIRDQKYNDRLWLNDQPSTTHSIVSYDGHKLMASHIKAADSKGRCVICVHGFHSTGYKEFASIARFYLENGIDVLLTDQRANGQSESNIMTFGAREQEDVLRWVEYARNTFADTEYLALHGVSMGAASVLLTANRLNPEYVKCVIGDCGYTDAKEQLIHTISSVKLPGKMFTYIYRNTCCLMRLYDPFKISPIKSVEEATVPVIIAHGEDDVVVPVKMAYELYEACPKEGKKLVIGKGANHTQAFYYNEEYGKVLLEVLS